MAQDTKRNIQALWEKEGRRLIWEVVGGEEGFPMEAVFMLRPEGRTA